jgi:hypothetical protein
MAGEFRDRTIAFRVEGDVLEVIPLATGRDAPQIDLSIASKIDADNPDIRAAVEDRNIPLAQLAVRVTPAGSSGFTIVVGKSILVGKDGQELPPGPLYAVAGKNDWGIKGAEVIVPRDKEPLYREFFASIAPLCDDREVLEPPPPAEKRGLFGWRKSS